MRKRSDRLVKLLLWFVVSAACLLVALLIVRLSPTSGPDESVSGNMGQDAPLTGATESAFTPAVDALKGSRVYIDFVGDADVRKNPEVTGEAVSDVSGTFLPGPLVRAAGSSVELYVVVHPVYCSEWYVYGPTGVGADDRWFVSDVEMGHCPYEGRRFQVWAVATNKPLTPGRTSGAPWQNHTGSWVRSQEPVTVTVAQRPVIPPGWVLRNDEGASPVQLHITQVGGQTVDWANPHGTVETVPTTSVHGTFRGPRSVRVSLLVRGQQDSRWVPIAREIPLQGTRENRHWRVDDVYIPAAGQLGSRQFQMLAIAGRIPVLADEIDASTIRELQGVHSNTVTVITLGWYPPRVQVDAVEAVGDSRWRVAGKATDLPEGSFLQLLTRASGGEWYWPSHGVRFDEAPRDHPDTQTWSQVVQSPPEAGGSQYGGEASDGAFDIVAAVMIGDSPLDPGMAVGAAQWQRNAVGWRITHAQTAEPAPRVPGEKGPLRDGDASQGEPRPLTISHIADRPVSEDRYTNIPSEASVRCERTEIPRGATIWIARRCVEGGGWSVARQPALQSEDGWVVEDVDFGKPLPGQVLRYCVRAFVWSGPAAPHDPDLEGAFARAVSLSPVVRVYLAAPGARLPSSDATNPTAGKGIFTMGNLVSAIIILAGALLALLLLVLVILSVVITVAVLRSPYAIRRLSKAASREMEDSWPQIRMHIGNFVIGAALLGFVLYMLVRFYPFYTRVLQVCLGVSGRAASDWALFLLGAVAVAGVLLHLQSQSSEKALQAERAKDELRPSASTGGDEEKPHDAASTQLKGKRDRPAVARRQDRYLNFLWFMTVFLWIFEGAMVSMYLGKAGAAWYLLVAGFFAGLFCSFIETVAFLRITALLLPHALAWAPALIVACLRVAARVSSDQGDSLMIFRVDGQAVGPDPIGAGSEALIEGVCSDLPSNLAIWLIITGSDGAARTTPCQNTQDRWQAEVALDGAPGDLYRVQAVAAWADPSKPTPGSRPVAQSQVVSIVLRA